MSNVVAGIRANVNDILSIRDSIGAALKVVNIVTRTWSGTELGEGDMSESKVRVLPSPHVVQYTNDLRLLQGGAVQQGDVMLKAVSQQSFPTQTDVDCSSELPNVEKFYELDGILYRVIAVTQKHVTWQVLLRRVGQQARP